MCKVPYIGTPLGYPWEESEEEEVTPEEEEPDEETSPIEEDEPDEDDITLDELEQEVLVSTWLDAEEETEWLALRLHPPGLMQRAEGDTMRVCFLCLKPFDLAQVTGWQWSFNLYEHQWTLPVHGDERPFTNPRDFWTCPSCCSYITAGNKNKRKYDEVDDGPEGDVFV